MGPPADGCCEIRKHKARALRGHGPSCFHGFSSIFTGSFFLFGSHFICALDRGKNLAFSVGSTPCATSSGSAEASAGAPAPWQARWGRVLRPKAGPAGQLRPGSRRHHNWGTPGPAVHAQQLLGSISSGKLYALSDVRGGFVVSWCVLQ